MESIDEQILRVNWNNVNEVADFYESNMLYFNNYHHLEDLDKINSFIDVKIRYVNVLFDKAQYDKTLNIIEHVKELLPKLGADHWNYQNADRHVRFRTGTILYNKRNYKEAYPIFKQLVKEDPEHHFYQIWYNHTRLGLYTWVFNSISFVGVGLVLLDLIFPSNSDSFFDLGNIGLVLVLLSWLISSGVSAYIKNEKSKSRES